MTRILWYMPEWFHSVLLNTTGYRIVCIDDGRSRRFVWSDVWPPKTGIHYGE